MPNQDNIVHVVGKPKKKPRGKRQTKKRFQAWVRTAKDKLVNAQQGPSTFLPPDHRQETMVELDDAIPLPTPEWKPQNHTTVGEKKQNAGLKFEKKLQAKFDSKTKPTEDKEEGREVRWELNTVQDHTSDVTPTEKNWSVSGNLKSPVVQGFASDIKLLVSDKKKSVTSVQSRLGEPVQKVWTSKAGSEMLYKGALKVIVDPERNITGKRITTLPQVAMEVPEKKPKGLAHHLMDTQGVQPFGSAAAYLNYPKGVPRTFLMQQQVLGAIQPQLEGTGRSPVWSVDTQHLDSFSAPTSDQTSPVATGASQYRVDTPVHVQTNNSTEIPQQYSPSDIYEDGQSAQEAREGSTSPEIGAGYKRLSAFQRLGPLTQPKKPKLTINLLCNKDIREVVKDTDPIETNTAVHLRTYMVGSTDETVIKYLPLWPWKKNVVPRKDFTMRPSRSVMILEQEQMEEAYDKENMYFQVSLKGYPESWRKEDVLDVLLEAVKGKSFIPCFIEFNHQECKFLVIRCRSALTAIHKLCFAIRSGDVELKLKISVVDLSLKHLDFIPRLVLRKRLAQGYDGERKLSLKDFTTKQDISNMIYYPLNRATNQRELLQIQSTIAWDFLTDLDLSHNRITSIENFNLPKSTPKLKNLDLSFNCLEKATGLLRCRELPLHSIKLEGNPLCHDYIDPRHYVKVIRMIFTGLKEIDGIPVHLKGDMPPFKRNYCPEAAVPIVEKFLELYFPLLDSPPEERMRIEGMYHEKAVMTITYRNKLRYGPLHRCFRNLFLRSRSFEEGDEESIEGLVCIMKLIGKWPPLAHDRYTFTVDVLHHSDYSTILRISGILKLIAESLAEDEHLVAFTRTLVLTSRNGVEYKISNEMVYWDQPTKAYSDAAFQINTIRSRRLSLKFESAPDKDVQEKLIAIFMKITDIDKKRSERCLEFNEWNLKTALEHFTKLLKLDDLTSLNIPAEDSK